MLRYRRHHRRGETRFENDVGARAMAINDHDPANPCAQLDSGMAKRVEDHDWSSTPLGPRASWSPELQTFVRHILESHFPAAIVWGKNLVTIYNDAFRTILGDKPEALGRSFAEVWAEAWSEIGPIANRALSGHATYVEDFPLLIDRKGALEQAWFTFCYSPLRLGDGTVAGFMDTVIETSATVRARAGLAMANQELSHRLKNTLAIVQSIAMQTLKAVEPRSAVEAFEERIAALGRAHDVLLRGEWSSVAFHQLARETLQPIDGLGQVSISGPDIEIGSAGTLTLSLVLHELATNASKYGALTIPSGRVDLKWAVEDDNVLRLLWREHDGPSVRAPTHQGFGSRLIDRCFGSRSKVHRRFLETGLETEIIVPLHELAC
jgi:two-component sensor histidine kinase/PAS domain-containing protein